MPNTPNIESANNSGFLWPTIADALDTFLRRRHNHADAYERVWRLIHVWEAVEITLAVTAMARVRQDNNTVDLLRRQREFFYGKAWDHVTQSFKSMQGAADGGIDQWISILDEVAKPKDLDGRFLIALQNFLRSEHIQMGPLLTAWAKACDVPPDFKRQGAVEVRQAMRYVNSFRNRFAHVPFPHDPLAEVSEALEVATEELFSVPPLPTSHEKGGKSSPLTGAVRFDRCFFHGNQLESLIEASTAQLEFLFPCQKRGDTIEKWPAQTFIHIDAMMRPHILTRVKGLDVCEYTRFRAEANAVLAFRDPNLIEMLPELVKAEYQVKEEPEPEPHPTREVTMLDAIEAIRTEDYDSAITFFERLTKERPDYHIGWLRLGHARREKAVRIASDHGEDALKVLRTAEEDLKQAAKHIDPEYRALAHYERSKVFFHLARLQHEDNDSRHLSQEEAEEACNLSTETKYQTWWDYLQVRGT